MKKLIFLVIIGLTSCTDIITDGDVYSGEVKYHIVRVDGCQYLYNVNYNMFTHKGNCTNSIHQNKRPIVVINNDTLQ